MHIKVFAKKHSNPNALKGGIFVGMGPVCVQSDEDDSVSVNCSKTLDTFYFLKIL
ncbi:hypothetical protein [Candidatus Phytoplasma asteris]|uniref:hypothetical protein n=1 Tax=Candidatus Phytoplasma asteris TaxID=85620 RepID=UPI0039E0C51A